jgi:putative transposase
MSTVENLYPQRKKIRLGRGAYFSPAAICSVTVSTLNRAPAFRELPFTGACRAALRSRAEKTGVALHAYCFMPDHLHLLISPSGETSIVDFIRDFKSMSTRIGWQLGQQGKLWQPRFYDHFLRQDEDLERAVSYVLNNPVRAGIVDDWRAYPFSGSLVYDL